MSYAAAINQLNSMTPELHTRPGQTRRKFSLDEIGLLLEALGNPQRSFPSVLIAGTNGKGSTACTLASVLSASGMRTALYTSPHLTRVNERMRVDRLEIADEDFARLFFRVSEQAKQLVEAGRLPQMPSFFEILTAQALLYFAEQNVQIAILEVGMGGRLDATNIVDPILSVITDISLDHTEWLGSTLAAIAREKAGILRHGGTLISLSQLPEVDQVLRDTAAEKSVRCVDAGAYLPPEGFVAGKSYTVQALGAVVEVDTPLFGDHQRRNLALAIAAAVELAGGSGFPVTAQTIAQGIHQTSWPGRMEWIQRGDVEWILDVAHNPAGVEALRAGLRSAFNIREEKTKTLVFSCLRDKPAVEMAQTLFPLFDQVILAPIHSPRATRLEDLKSVADTIGSMAYAVDSVAEALRIAGEKSQGGVVVVAGSVYLVGEARPFLMNDTREY